MPSVLRTNDFRSLNIKFAVLKNSKQFLPRKLSDAPESNKPESLVLQILMLAYGQLSFIFVVDKICTDARFLVIHLHCLKYRVTLSLHLESSI